METGAFYLFKPLWSITGCESSNIAPFNKLGSNVLANEIWHRVILME
jgi:hypothetical protein